MIQIIPLLNYSDIQNSSAKTETIELRGYSEDVILSGDLVAKLSNGDISALSVNDIARKICPTRRDLYLKKGKKRRKANGNEETWSSVMGNEVEAYLQMVYGETPEQSSTYSELIGESERIHQQFLDTHKEKIERVKSLEGPSDKTGFTKCMLNMLNLSGRADFGASVLHKAVGDADSIGPEDILFNESIEPKKEIIGINSPSNPDFIIPKFKIIGDIKTGQFFDDNFLLTCTGYALAYENANGEGHDIDWGAIYFLSTYVPKVSARPLTFPQLYLFPIDDYLRGWFIDRRTQDYDVTSSDDPPKLPVGTERKACGHCKFLEICKEDGLEIQ